VDEECTKPVDTMINKEKLEALKFKCTSSRQWSHEDEHTEKCNSSKPIESTFDQDSTNLLLDTLSLKISRLTSIGENCETCLIVQNAYQYEWICEVDALRFLNKGLQAVAYALIKDGVEAIAKTNTKFIFGANRVDRYGIGS